MNLDCLRLKRHTDFDLFDGFKKSLAVGIVQYAYGADSLDFLLAVLAVTPLRVTGAGAGSYHCSDPTL